VAELIPFRGLVYREDLKQSMDRLTTPPYDIISKEAQDAFYRKDPNNVIRLELPIPPSPETPERNRYTEARRELDRMRSEGVLTVDAVPAIYPYSMTFSDPFTKQERTIRGLIARIRLEEWDKKVVYPHERTLAGPKEDRMALFKATEASFSQIFCLYSDPKGDVVQKLYEKAVTRFSAIDGDGVRHVLSSVSEPSTVSSVQDFFSRIPLFIADGHHRYETYLAYRNFRRKTASSPDPSAPYEYITVFLAALEDPSLTVLPTHRLVHNVPKSLVDALFQENGALKTEAVYPLEKKSEFLRRLVESDAGRIVFGLVRKSPAELRVATLVQSKGPGVRSLDSYWLQEAVLGPVLGITPERVAKEDLLRYNKSADEVVSKVSAGEYAAGFILRPSSPRVVEDVSLRGELMPQKSTYFYPKPLTGMVMTLL
jgi:uncharacterized protein (DUF1015 family)